MSQSAKDVVRKWFAEVWNGKDSSAIERIADPQCVIHGLGEGGPSPGALAHFKQFHALFCATYPDMSVSVDDMIEEGDRVAWRITFRGTHSGDALGVPATNRPIEVGGIGISRVANGRIIEGWNEFDRYGMFQQIGARVP
jgi:predicted ester cyclase